MTTRTTTGGVAAQSTQASPRRPADQAFMPLRTAAWLAGIIVNLLLLGDYYDVALRDFGLLVAALALARLATTRKDTT